MNKVDVVKSRIQNSPKVSTLVSRGKKIILTCGLICYDVQIAGSVPKYNVS